MAGFTYSTLTTAIQNYTEVGTGVLSSTITDQFIDNSELRIQREIPIDADRKEMLGNLTASKDNVYAPAGTLFVRGLQVYTSTTAATGANSWLEKKDISFLIVTHHRLTMAKMNKLLGVTMEEKGISKLLSVDLEKAVEIKEAS